MRRITIKDESHGHGRDLQGFGAGLLRRSVPDRVLEFLYFLVEDVEPFPVAAERRKFRNSPVKFVTAFKLDYVFVHVYRFVNCFIVSLIV